MGSILALAIVAALVGIVGANVATGHSPFYSPDGFLPTKPTAAPATPLPYHEDARGPVMLADPEEAETAEIETPENDPLCKSHAIRSTRQ